MSTPQYKILLLGECGVGKSTKLNDLLKERTFPTIGVNMHPLRVNTNRGEIILNVWDVSGDRTKYARGYYNGANGIVIMGHNSTKEHVEYWTKEARYVVGEHAPIMTMERETNFLEVLGEMLCEMRKDTHLKVISAH